MREISGVKKPYIMFSETCFIRAHVLLCPYLQANLTIGSNAVGEKFKCLAFTLEMPFKDTADRPDAFQGWSPERSMALGATVLQPIAEALPNLR